MNVFMSCNAGGEEGKKDILTVCFVVEIGNDFCFSVQLLFRGVKVSYKSNFVNARKCKKMNFYFNSPVLLRRKI